MCANKEAQTRDVPARASSRMTFFFLIFRRFAAAAPRSADCAPPICAPYSARHGARQGWRRILSAIEQGLARDPQTLPKLRKDKRGPPRAPGEPVEVSIVLLKVCDQAGASPPKRLIATQTKREDDASMRPTTRLRCRRPATAAHNSRGDERSALTVENGKSKWKRDAGTRCHKAAGK